MVNLLSTRSPKTRIPQILILATVLAVPGVFASPGGLQDIDTVSGDVPALVQSIDPEKPWPVFVAAELAVTPSGAVAEDLFRFPAASSIRSGLKMPMRDGCIAWGEAYHFGVVRPELNSVPALVAGSDPIVRGRVTGSRAGFFHGVPGQLLKIEILARLKGEQNNSYGYVFYPVARFEVGGTTICKTDVRYARVPDVGDEILVFAQGVREEAAEPFFDLPDNGAGVIYLGPGDGESLPQELRENNSEKSGRELLVEVEAELQARGRPETDEGVPH